MKVRAIQMGYHDHLRRREGDVFTIPDTPRRKPSPKELQYFEAGMKPAMDKDGTVPQVYSARWMRPVAANAPEKVSTAQAAINKRHDELRQEKAGALPADSGETTGNADVI